MDTNSIAQNAVRPFGAAANNVVRRLIAVLSVAALAAVCVSTSAEAGPGGVCGRTRHRLDGHCVSALVEHPSQPKTDRMA